jgi:hypothetical protein
VTFLPAALADNINEYQRFDHDIHSHLDTKFNALDDKFRHVENSIEKMGTLMQQRIHESEARFQSMITVWLSRAVVMVCR